MATPVPDGLATPGAGTPESTPGTQPITLLGVVCASEELAGTYAYLPGGGEQGPVPDATGTCRHATVGEMEFLLLDNTEPNRLYDDAQSGSNGGAVALAPVGRSFFVTEFRDDPDPDTGLASGSAAILIPPDPADRQPVSLTVVRYVAPGAVGLTAGTLFLSTVVCPPGAGDSAITVLGPDATILLVPPGTAPGTPQPGSDRECAEVAADFRITPYDRDDVTIELTDGADDGALIARLPATIATDGTRAFSPYELTERTSGATVVFDIREGHYTSIRVVLDDSPATPVASRAPGSSSGPGPGAASVGPGTATAADGTQTPPAPGATGTPADPTTVADADDGAGGISPIRWLWAALALLGLIVLLASVRVLRRPAGHRRNYVG